MITPNDDLITTVISTHHPSIAILHRPSIPFLGENLPFPLFVRSFKVPARMQIGNFEIPACSFKVLPPLLKNGHIRSFFDPYTKAIVIKIVPPFLIRYFPRICFSKPKILCFELFNFHSFNCQVLLSFHCFKKVCFQKENGLLGFLKFTNMAVILTDCLNISLNKILPLGPLGQDL